MHETSTKRLKDKVRLSKKCYPLETNQDTKTIPITKRYMQKPESVTRSKMKFSENFKYKQII